MEAVPAHKKFAIIQEMAGCYGSIQQLCEIAGVSRSGYYKWVKRQEHPSQKHLEDEQLKEKIKECHEEVKGIYGYRRVQVWLKRKYQLDINHKRVQRLMREMGMQAVIRKKRPYYGKKEPYVISDNHLNRDFHASKPNEKWVTDITYLIFNGQKLYLSAIKDLEFDQDAWEQARRKASRFVLVTTVPEEWKDRRMDEKEILKLYKGQISVEMNFSFLKDPFFTDEIYVKKPERVAVLGYLFLLALAIYRVFQRRVRQFITPERPLKGAGGRKLTRPTGQAIFQLFWYVKVVLLELPDGQIQRALGKPLTYEQRRILQELGMDESIYV